MGGTFDPIHKAHIRLARCAAQQYGLERVIFMTGGDPPHKTALTPAAARLDMVRLAIAGIPDMSASDYEVKLKVPSYSVNTLAHLKTEYPDTHLYFIIGEDSLEDFDSWYKPQEILEYCTLLVYPRKGADSLKGTAASVRERFGGEIKLIDAPIYDISSTAVRRLLKRGGDASNYLDARVAEYIRKNKLYGCDVND